MEYRALIQGVKGRRTLIPASKDVYEFVKDYSKDWYSSIFTYTQEQFDEYNKTSTLAGMKDVKTNSLIWDFDDALNPENARRDTKELCARLIEFGLSPDDISICFSGNKGFSIALSTDQTFTVEEFKSINTSLAAGLETNDTTICDSQRIFRVIGTKHNKTECYKYPINLTQLSEMPVEEIKLLACDPTGIENPYIPQCILPTAIQALKKEKEKKLVVPIQESTDVSSLDFKFKPRGFTNCKFAILNGFVPPGNRNNCFMALAATCKMQGYPQDVTYNMCKAAIRLQAQRYNQEPFSKEELWNNIILQVYRDSWQGGTFSCKKEPWLKEYCESLGTHKCKHIAGEDIVISVEDISAQFEDYSVNIDKNTIKTGIAALDDNVRLTTGMPVGLLGAPSSGKTTLALEMLANTSRAGLHSVFFSMDMYAPLVYQKQVQRQFGLSANELYRIFQQDVKRKKEINEAIKNEYKNVQFSTKSGHSVQQMREMVDEHEQTSGHKVKLVMIDYLECISGPYSDATANSQKVAGELRDFATETGRCVTVLVQPPKVAGDASEPLRSMRQIKGSSMLEQSFRVILGIYREGFGPKYSQEWDKFITINSLKNTMGPLFSVDNYWNGARGKITPIDSDGEMQLEELRQLRKADKASDSSSAWG